MNNYFSHDSNARNSDKLLPVRMKYGAEGYGIYFMILERLREEKNYMSVKDYNMLAFDLRVDTGKLKSIVEDFGLFAFTDDGKCFYSEGFNKRMEIKDEKSKKRSEAGKKGAAKRWQSDGNAIAKPTDSDSKESKGNETKGNKTKENTSSNAREQATGTEGPLSAFAAWQSVWKFPNAFQQQDLQELIDKYTDDLVTASIKIAARKDVKNGSAINFLESVLTEWTLAGVKSLDDARAYETSRNNERKQAREHQAPKNNYGKPFKTEKLPDWNQYQEEAVSPEEQAKLDTEIENRMAELGMLED